MDIVPQLLASPLFKPFPHGELATLASAMAVSRYPAGHVFIKEGQRGDAMYLILEGEVAVTRYNPQDRSVDEIHRMGSGEVFGLISLIDHGKRTATCTAVSEVTAASLPTTAFELLYQSHAPISHHFQLLIARQLAHDLRVLNEALLDLLLGRTAQTPDGLDTLSHEHRGPERRRTQRRIGT